MPRKTAGPKKQATPAQLAALARARQAAADRRATGGAAPQRRKPLETAEDFIEAEGLDEPIERPQHRPHAKAKPESLITPELSLAAGAILNRTAQALAGAEAAMTPDEALGVTSPLLRIGARAAAKLLERMFPAGLNNIEDGNLRDLAASVTSLGKYALRQWARQLWALEARRASRQGDRQGPDVAPPPPPVYRQPPNASMADYDDGPAPAMPDVAAEARTSTNGVLAGGMAALAGIIPTDMGQGMM